MADQHPLVGFVLRGRYRIIERHGAAGTAAALFRAVRLDDGGEVMVRILAPAALSDADADSSDAGRLAGFELEQERIAEAAHPTLVTPLDYGVVTIRGVRCAFTVVPYFERGNLREVLDRGRRLSASQALVVGLDACRALRQLHSHGVVHGDVRPANLYLTPEGKVRLDVTGRRRGAGTEGLSLEQARYASPEVAVGEVASERSDVYSLAMTLLEAITGETPFEGESVAITLSNRVGRLLPVSADLGPIAALIERAGRPDPAERFDPLEFGRALASIAPKLPRPEPIGERATVSFAEVLETGRISVLPPPADRPTPPDERPTTPSVMPPTSLADTAPVPAPSQPVALDESTPKETTRVVVPSDVTIDASGEPLEVSGPRRRGGRRWSILVLVGVLVAAGAIVASQTILRPSHVIPDVIGMPEGEARNLLAPFDFVIEVRAERSDVAAAGTVLATDPAPGASLRQGSRILLVVAEGATLAVLPDVGGLPVDEVRALLEGLGLVATFTEAESEEIDAGFAISWVVPEQPGLAPGDEVLKGTTLEVVVSTGPTPREVPLIVGLTVDEAKALLDPLGLKLAPTEPKKSNAAAEGLIAEQSPPPGELVPRGSSIAFAVSLGPDLVELPYIVGNNFSIVETRLQEAGFVIGEVTGRKQNRLQRALIGGQEVSNGDLVPRGATVDLVFP